MNSSNLRTPPNLFVGVCQFGVDNILIHIPKFLFIRFEGYMVNIKGARCHPKKKHYSKGLCLSCYRKQYYENNPGIREKQKERVRKAIKRLYKRRMKEDPLWNAKRQREYIRKYPQRHYLQQARFYWKRLTPEQRKELIDGKA